MRNRVVKFRAWDAENNKMLTLNLYQCRYYNDFILRDHNDNKEVWVDDNIDKVRFPIMQFTGLTDKNGRELYENDIIKIEVFGELITPYGEIISEVKYFTEHAAFGFTTPNGWLTFYKNHYIEFEIIGNTFQNPQLLEG